MPFKNVRVYSVFVRLTVLLGTDTLCMLYLPLDLFKFFSGLLFFNALLVPYVHQEEPKFHENGSV